MKVFITGVAGFLGSHIADKMIDLGHEVVGCDNLVGGYLSNVQSGVQFHRFDLNSLEGLSALMEGCDIVYHTACTAYEGLSVFSPSLISGNELSIAIALKNSEFKFSFSFDTSSLYKFIFDKLVFKILDIPKFLNISGLLFELILFI